MKKILIIMLISIILLNGKGVYATSQYQLNSVKNGIQLENYVDGYNIVLPLESKIKFDANFYSANVDYKNVNAKILLQDIKGDEGYSTYVTYTKRGVEYATGDFNISYNNIIKRKDGNLSVIEYSREKLSKVKNDKNNYLTVFKKVPNNKVLTIIAKSNEKINREEILKIADSYKPNKKEVKRIIEKEPIDVAYDNSEKLLFGRKWDEKTASLYYKDFLKEHPLKWGIFTDAFWESPELREIEKHIGEKFEYNLMYHTFGNPNSNVKKAIDFAKKENRVVELTFQTEKVGNKNQIFEALNGKWDSYFREMAKIVADEKHPTLFRLANEMNGDWCSYSAWNTGLDTDIYKDFYNHVYKIFEEEGANKYLIYVFNPNGRSFPNYKFNDEVMYRPDSNKYDVIGLTLYNTGNYYEGEDWETFDELYSTLYKDVNSKYEKPMMITEFASNLVGGNKTKWVENMFDSIKNYPKIKVAVWFNGIDLNEKKEPARVYKINKPIEVLDVFKENMNK